MKWLCIFTLFVFIGSLARAAENKTTLLDVRIAFGYKDSRPARFVGDRYERLYLIQKLIRPCDEKVDKFICGFQRNREDLNILEKTWSNHKGSLFNLRLRITASSFGMDDEENRHTTYQKHLSKVSEINFFSGLSTADAVYYIGHSRDGGGPSFSPPVLKKDQHVDYNWYKKNNQSFHKMLKYLRLHSRQRPRHQLKLGLLSCASHQLFDKRIHQVSARTETLTVPNLIYYTDALKKVLEDLSALMSKKTNGSVRKNSRLN